jgi:glycosyltransferase involved in cell wall biosynthesis
MKKGHQSPKFSVLIVTYNQEALIGRALDSVLCQKDFVYEIIIADDCSTDNNWEVITEYKNRFPDIIKPYRNERNIGIMRNMESTWKKAGGDLMTHLAGDDAITEGLFATVIDFINSNQIDFKSEASCFFTDTRIIKPDGRETVFSNSLIEKGHNILSLKIRHKILSARGVFLSRRLMERLILVTDYSGLNDDSLIDMSIHVLAEKNYYIPFVGGIYYEGIGVSVSDKKPIMEKLMTEKMIYEKVLKSIDFCNQDINYMKFKINHVRFQEYPSLKSFVLTLRYYLLSFNPRYGVSVKSDFKLFIRMLIMLISKTEQRK